MELIVLPVSRRATYLTKYLSTYIPGGGIALVFVNPAVTDDSGVHLARSSLAIRHARNVGLVDCARAAARVGSRKDPLEPVCAVSGRRLIPKLAHLQLSTRSSSNPRSTRPHAV